MRQRVMIAMALANNPALLIADEPTTALDVTVQAQIVALLRSLNRELGTAVLLITHNVALVARLCQRMVVMYAGRVVEEGSTLALFAAPQAPVYLVVAAVRAGFGGAAGDSAGCDCRAATGSAGACGRVQVCAALSVPGGALWGGGAAVGGGGAGAAGAVLGVDAQYGGAGGVTLLVAEGLVKRFPLGRRQAVHAVDGVGLTLREGETLGLVGESGSGKSDVGADDRAAAGLLGGGDPV